MLAMSGASASPAVRAGERGRTSVGGVAGLLLMPATVLAVVAVAVLLLFTPIYTHLALDFAGAPATIGLPAELARRYSDMTVAELLFGPATFAFRAPDGSPFYGPDETAHLRDVRAVLFAFLAVAGLAAVVLAAGLWRWRDQPAVIGAVARAGATLALATFALGAFAALAFSLAFELFHRLLFPGGNWSFDPASARLVQLYPLPFWQLTAGVLALLLIGGGTAVWWLARRRAERLGRDG